jgi:hypothetical protein
MNTENTKLKLQNSKMEEDQNEYGVNNRTEISWLTKDIADSIILSVKFEIGTTDDPEYQCITHVKCKKCGAMFISEDISKYYHSSSDNPICINCAYTNNKDTTTSNTTKMYDELLNVDEHKKQKLKEEHQCHTEIRKYNKQQNKKKMFQKQSKSCYQRR